MAQQTLTRCVDKQVIHYRLDALLGRLQVTYHAAPIALLWRLLEHLVIPNSYEVSVTSIYDMIDELVANGCRAVGAVVGDGHVR